MKTVVGISQKIKRTWVDAVLDRLVETADEAALRNFIDLELQKELPGKASRAKRVGIISSVWSSIPRQRVVLRDRAVALLPGISGQERIWLHWGMTALAYPFFRDTAEVVGRLLALQDDFTTAQVQARIAKNWGDRVTIQRAAKYLLNTLVDWEVLRSTKKKGHFLLARKMTASIPELELWLLEALLGASAADEIEAQQLLRLPESFPFTLSVGVTDLRQDEGFDIHRQGLDMDMVALRKIRVSPIPKPERKPAAKPKLTPTLAPERIPVEGLPANAEPSGNHADKMLQTGLFDRLGDSPLDRSAVWANTVRAHISEAIRIIRENGDRGEAERLLILAHDAMSAFSELQAVVGLTRTVRHEFKAHEPTPTIELPKPAEAGKKTASKSKAVAANLLPPPSSSVIAELAGLKALSVRQPHAEAIMRKLKTEDVRSTATKIRGRILIYASLGRDNASEENDIMKDYGIDDIAIDDLPRGVLIGTVELHDCHGCKWHLRSPQRLETPVKPSKQPKPMWFNPF